MHNAFNETQLQVISDLAEYYWDQELSHVYDSSGFYIKASAKKRYVDDIINGLVDPEIWPDDGP